MELTLQTGQGPLTIDFDVRWSHTEERHIPCNITEKGRYMPLVLTDKQWDRVLDYLEDYEEEQDLLTPWLFGANFLEKY